MTKLAPEWVRTTDPVIRSPARYRWTTAPAPTYFGNKCVVYNVHNLLHIHEDVRHFNVSLNGISAFPYEMEMMVF